MPGMFIHFPFFCKKKGRKLKAIKNDDMSTVFLLSVRTRYSIIKIKKSPKQIKTIIRLTIILPSCHRKNLLSRNQNKIPSSKQNTEKQEVLIIFISRFKIISNILF